MKQIADEELTDSASKAGMVYMAHRQIWLASSISRMFSSAEPSTGFSFLFICSALRAWMFRSY